MTTAIDVDEGVDLFLAGADAVRVIAARLTAEQWHQPACGEWTATQTARHVLAVARWYHLWLDLSLEGDTTPPFPAHDLPQRNAAALDALSAMSGPAAVVEFNATTTVYARRLRDNWDHPYGYPFGTVTTGLHGGVATAEWHLHAWDLSTVAGPLHEPEHAERIFLAAGSCVAAAEGGFRGAVLRHIVPLAATRSPWPSLLRRSGRTARR